MICHPIPFYKRNVSSYLLSLISDLFCNIGDFFPDDNICALKSCKKLNKIVIKDLSVKVQFLIKIRIVLQQREQEKF